VQSLVKDPSGVRTMHSRKEHYGKTPLSFLFPGAPRGMTTVLLNQKSLPKDAQTPGGGPSPKIDWTYLDEAHRGKNLTEKYFKAIEDTARAQGAPSIHVYASNSGVGYWAQPRFGLKLDKASSEALHRTYEISRENNPKYQKVTKGDVHKYPRDFMEEVGFLLNMLKKPTYIHYYKKLDEPKKEGG